MAATNAPEVSSDAARSHAGRTKLSGSAGSMEDVADAVLAAMRENYKELQAPGGALSEAWAAWQAGGIVAHRVQNCQPR
jgi:hypothetical protein